MDLIPLSSRRLQRENTEEGQGQVTPPLPLPKPGPLPASPCSHPPSGGRGAATGREKGQVFKLHYPRLPWLKGAHQ